MSNLEMDIQQNDIEMNDILRFYPATANICEKLSFKDLMSLSFTSKSLWDATYSEVIKRSVLHIRGPRKIQRNYKHWSLTFHNSFSFSEYDYENS